MVHTYGWPSRLASEDSGQKLDVAPPARPMTYPVSVPNATALASRTGLKYGQLRMNLIIFFGSQYYESDWISRKIGYHMVPPEFCQLLVIC